MLRAIEAAGRRNYSLFAADDGQIVGYYETDDDEAAQAALATDPPRRRVGAEMAGFFVDFSGCPDQAAPRLTQTFNLEDQLAALPAAAIESDHR